MLFRVLSKEVGRQVPKIAFPSRNQSQWHKKQRGLTGRKFQIKWKFLWREIHRAFRRTVAPEIRASSSSGPLASDKTIFTGYRATGAREVKPSTSIVDGGTSRGTWVEWRCPYDALGTRKGNFGITELDVSHSIDASLGSISRPGETPTVTLLFSLHPFAFVRCNNLLRISLFPLWPPPLVARPDGI